jgi:hypothetical protein
MALPRRQQRLPEAIDHQVTSADPRLARLFGTFGRLWAGERLPARELRPTRASRLWPGLWEALAAGVWPAPPLTDPPMADAAGGPSAGRGSIPAPPGQARQAPDGPAQSGQDDRQPRGRGENCRLTARAPYAARRWPTRWARTPPGGWLTGTASRISRRTS